MRSLLAPLIAAAGLLLAATASGAAQPAPAFDAWYLQTAIGSDRFEIKGGTLATEQGSSSKVKTLGQRLAIDHARTLTKETKAAKSLGVSVPGSASPLEQWALITTRSQSGSDFDRAWATLQIQAHQQMIQATKKEIAVGRSDAVRQLAKANLPMLVVHWKQAQAALKSLG